ncbi:MAG: hypothetical protein MJZ81_10545 [Bacteroidales bacterium]|nr:hypothetical protein [Bacteroidales bacterium]
MKRLTLIVATLLLLCSACHRNDYMPKPSTYLRFDFPAKAYQTYDTAALPFTFEGAKEANITVKKNTPTDKWVDILYPNYRGVVFLSYKTLRGPEDLRGQIDTSYELLKMHFDHSSGVDERQFVNPQKKVYASTYLLKGSNVASTYQFWVTDSTHHFLRGSLFLDCTPNNDSLAPVLDYLQQDLKHLLETLTWR